MRFRSVWPFLSMAVFLSTVAAMIRIFAGFLGLPPVFSSHSGGMRAMDAAFAELAKSQFSPSEPSAGRAVTLLAQLSLAGFGVPRRAAAIPAPPSYRAGVRSVPWNALVQSAAAKMRRPHRITVGWSLDAGTQTLEQAIANSPGLSVFAPKWLYLSGSNGTLGGQVNESVVRFAHARGVKVWAVVSNGFNGVLSHQVLQYRDRQDALISAIVRTATASGLNGINLDFEGLLSVDRWNYSRFVAVLAARLHARGMELTVDLPPDLTQGNNSGPYNHRAIAQSANDVILMGYDQFWGGESVAGPTASLPWVASGVADMLETGVPASRLILGVPFYTQDWTLGPRGQVVSSVALSLLQLQNILRSVHAQKTWLPRLGVHFVHYVQGGQRHVIWVVDRRSLLLTLQMVARDHLAGAAAWYLGLEPSGTWVSLVDSVRSRQT